MKHFLNVALICAVILPALTTRATTYNLQVGADTFVSSGQPNNNFGSLGAMEIAAATAAQPRTEMTLLSFDTSALQAAFDADYGPANWMVTSVLLTLFSNVSTAGQQPGNASLNRIAAGNFEFDLLSNNNWSESSITWNTLPNILPGSGSNSLTSLGTFFWPASGSASSIWTLNLDANLVDAISDGSQITILGQPTAGSTVGYLFNTLTFNPGYLTVTAESVPEPSSLTFAISFMCVVACARFAGTRVLLKSSAKFIHEAALLKPSKTLTPALSRRTGEGESLRRRLH
jgi:hypothetical protein